MLEKIQKKFSFFWKTKIKTWIYEDKIQMWEIYIKEDIFITFVMPTIGRNTIDISISSLVNQTKNNWVLYIIFDNVPISENFIKKYNSLIQESKIIIFYLSEKKGIGKNWAGNVRNFVADKIMTPRVAFLDDDDTLTKDYIEKLQEEIFLNTDFDVLIFRMLSSKWIIKNTKIQVIPKTNKPKDVIKVWWVGISFVLKSNIFKQFQFKPSSIEDFDLLNRIKKSHYKIIVSPFITYIVREANIENLLNTNFKRLKINY